MRTLLGSAISFARWRGLLPIALSLGIFVLSINFALLWLIGSNPRTYAQPQIALYRDQFESAADAVASLVRSYRTSPEAEKKSFVLYTGLSTALEGVDPISLGAHIGCDERVMGICGLGSSMYALLEMQKAVLSGNLKPRLVVVCLHPEWLAGGIYAPPESLNPIDPLRRDDWREAARRIRWWNWIGNSSAYVNQAVFKFLYALRVNLGTAGYVDPWRPQTRIGFAAYQGAEAIRKQLAYFDGFGWFDRRRYVREEEGQAAELRTLISSYRARGSEVLLVMMPETRGFLNRVPPEAERFLLEYVTREFRTAPVPILDYRDAIRDNGFTDAVHMNDAGRAQFTLLLAAGIKNVGLVHDRGCPDFR